MRQLRPLDFLDEVIAERTAKNPRFPELVAEQLAARRKTPVLVCCPLCGEPFEAGPQDFRCGCTAEVPDADGLSRWRRIDLEVREEGAVLGWAILAERYGVIDGRPRSVAEVARARRTTRKKVRELEGRALREWREIHARASA